MFEMLYFEKNKIVLKLSFCLKFSVLPVLGLECVTVEFICIIACVSDIFEPGSSVSVVSGYRLDDCAVEVQSLAEAKGLFL
jgi:hypothetical protein